MKLKRRILFVFLSLILITILIVGFRAWGAYRKAFSINTPSTLPREVLLIPTGAALNDVLDSLEINGQILNRSFLEWTAAKMNYRDETVKKGRYIIPAGVSSKDLITLLRSGNQTPLSIAIHEVRSIEQLCGRVGTKLELDSFALWQWIDLHFDTMAGTEPATRLTRFIPNTYEFYWTVTPEEFCKRMLKENDRFWNESRRSSALAIGMSIEEVYTLASIIEKETQYNPEKSRMAGVYLNRLRLGIPLQADPTVVFAIGDFTIRRVLTAHLQVDSPYNTYQHAGLPPGPIYMPSIASIDAVLNAEDHDYLYFCARPANEGPGHAFAATLQAHNVNAARYQRWLNAEGIFR